MRWKSVILTILGLLVLLGIIWLVNFLWLRPVNIEDFYERIVYDQAELNSEYFIQLPNNNRDHFSPFRVEFHERTPSFYEKRSNLSRDHLTDLQSYPLKYQTSEELISSKSIEHVLSHQTAAVTFSAQYHLLESLHPIHDPIFFLLYQQPVSNLEEAKAYTTRLKAISQSYRQIINGLKVCESQRTLPPTTLVEAKISQLKSLISISPDQHPLYLNYAKKLVRISRMEIKEFEQVDYLASTEKSIKTSVFPACEQLINYLETLLPKTTDHFSESFLGENQAFYQHLLNGYLGNGFSPQELHEKGKEAVKKYQLKTQKIIDSLEIDLPKSNISPLLSDDLLNDSLTDTYLKGFNEKIEASAFKWAGILGTDIPQNIETVVLSDVFPQIDFFYQPEGFKEKTQAQLYLNPKQIQHLNMLDVFAYTIPGHHYQTHQRLQNGKLSLFARVIRGTALQNGWLLYSQHLGEEYGFLAREPHNIIRFLDNFLLYAGILVVDTGIFSQGWSVNEAKTYMRNTIGLNQADTEKWLAYILNSPGKYTTYWMGYERILALRERAKSVQGLRFNIADFHQWIVEHQTIPLSDIEVFFENYLNSPIP